MSDFTKRLLEWYDENPRELPWKESQDAYSVWLSEIIMQQTRVEYGSAYYLKFKELFPTVFHLADADLGEVLKAWEGLGYYSRARNLHHTAKLVAYEKNGEFPKSYEALQKLKGVGAYTAAAIVSFVHNEPIPAIDGNAFRVLSRVFGIKKPIDEAKNRAVYFKKAKELIDDAPKRAGDFNQAMMNFGAMVCKPKGASCESCPFSAICYAYQHDEVYQLPKKKKKPTYKHRHFTFFCIEYNEEIMVEERTGKDVWKNLYQFYLVENEKPVAWEKCIEQSPLAQVNSKEYHIKKVWQEKQTLTHQKLAAQIIWVKLLEKPVFYEQYKWVLKSKLESFPFPKMLQQAVRLLQANSM